MTREEAIRSLQEDGINLGAGDFVDVEALKIAVADMQAMERLEQTRALVVREASEDDLKELHEALKHAACGIVKLEPGEDICALTTCKGVESDTVKVVDFDQFNRWISVEERLPEELRRVLVRVPEQAEIIGKPAVDTDRVVNGRWVRWGKYVTHWKSLPEGEV